MIESSAPIPMSLVADDEVHFLFFQNLARCVNYIIFFARNSQTIHDCPDAQIAKLLVPVHGSREHNRPTAGLRTGINDQAQKSGIAHWIPEIKDLAVPTRQ